jgi:hypothetical protein
MKSLPFSLWTFSISRVTLYSSLPVGSNCTDKIMNANCPCRNSKSQKLSHWSSWSSEAGSGFINLCFLLSSSLTLVTRSLYTMALRGLLPAPRSSAFLTYLPAQYLLLCPGPHAAGPLATYPCRTVLLIVAWWPLQSWFFFFCWVLPQLTNRKDASETSGKANTLPQSVACGGRFVSSVGLIYFALSSSYREDMCPCVLISASSVASSTPAWFLKW